MESRYGYRLDRWDAAKVEVRDILIELAKNGAGNTIAYSELATRIQAIQIDPDSYAFAHMLGEISTAEVEAGRGMLSVLVVHLRGDRRPGGGFYASTTWRRGSVEMSRTRRWRGSLS